MRIFVTALFAALTVVPAAAGEEPVELKKVPGIDRVEANCGACHSLDYIPMNSPFLNAAGWDAEVAKMISAFGAPIDQADARIIADYLKNNYGTIQTNDAGGAAARSSLALDNESKGFHGRIQARGRWDAREARYCQTSGRQEARRRQGGASGDVLEDLLTQIGELSIDFPVNLVATRCPIAHDGSKCTSDAVGLCVRK